MFLKYENVSLIDWNFFEPTIWKSSAEIEEEVSELYARLKLSAGRLELMTGIKLRGLFPMGSLPSDLAAKAALPILNKSVPNPEIGLLIYTGVSRDCLEPSTASRVHHSCQLSPQCINFDISNACLGFMSGIEVAAQMIERGAIRYALICSGENGNPLLSQTIKDLNSNSQISRQDLKKYFASLTIGAGAAAMLLGPTKLHPQCPQLSFTHSMAHTAATFLCQGDGNLEGMWMETDAEKLLQAGLGLASQHWNDLSHHTNWNKEYNHLFMHQVGRAHELASAELLKLDKQKLWNIFETYGNMGSVALPATLIKADQSKRLKSDDKILMLGIGSGLNSLIAGVEWRS
jgi:3-oxoacyl-[acyl-carrier-protein] synthase III